MPSMESVARVAFALRNDLTVNNLAPFSNVALCSASDGLARRTLFTVSVTMLPSFFSNFCGLTVL